jgi:hypothetical protein
VDRSALWMLLPGALGAALGGVIGWLDRRAWSGPLLALLGTGVCLVVAASRWQGALSLWAGFAALGVVSLVLAAERQSRGLQAVGWVAFIGQLGALVAGHPSLGATCALTTAGWSAIAALTALLLWLASRQALTPRPVCEGLRGTAVIIAGAVVSTFLGALSGLALLLTPLWAACAVLGWWWGRERGGRERAWPRIAAGGAAAAAVIKLVAWDWPRLGIVACLGLMLLVGGILLVSPLVGRTGERRPAGLAPGRGRGIRAP